MVLPDEVNTGTLFWSCFYIRVLVRFESSPNPSRVYPVLYKSSMTGSEAIGIVVSGQILELVKGFVDIMSVEPGALR